jgi:FkbM family methyltransferase
MEADRPAVVITGGGQTVEDLIYDVGMHDGTDTDFYLKKGFRVVAIEADPTLVLEARARFSDAIGAGRLIILNVAVSDRDGVATFYRCPEQDRVGIYSSTGLSTTVQEVAEKTSKRVGVHFEPIEVEACRFETLLAQHGIPYYLKVDIEGAEALCVRALDQFSERPKYVSVEITHRRRDRHLEDLCHLYLLDYRWFKIIDQRFLHKIRLPQPAGEGVYVSHEFGGHTTGPFGEETPGRWLSFEEIIPRYATPRRKDTWFWGTRDAWFDLHAKLDEEGSSIKLPRESAGLYTFLRAAMGRVSWVK